jgi:hypothetical protein
VVAPAKPLKPRPILFIVLCLLLAIWVGYLLVLYFAAVYPARHAPASERASVQI